MIFERDLNFFQRETLSRHDSRGVDAFLQLPVPVQKHYSAAGLIVELTNYCDGGCPFCANSVIPKKGHVSAIPLEAVCNLIKTMGPQELTGDDIERRRLIRPDDYHYMRTDPFSYADYPQLVDFSLSHGRLPRTTTSIPPGSEQRVADFIRSLQAKKVNNPHKIKALNWGISDLRISLTPHNGPRLQRVRALVGDELWTYRVRQGVLSFQDLQNPDRIRSICKDKIRSQDVVGIACSDGVVITPSDVEAVIVMPQCQHIPGGLLTLPFSEHGQIFPTPQKSSIMFNTRLNLLAESAPLPSLFGLSSTEETLRFIEGARKLWYWLGRERGSRDLSVWRGEFEASRVDEDLSFFSKLPDILQHDAVLGAFITQTVKDLIKLKKSRFYFHERKIQPRASKIRRKWGKVKEALEYL